MIKQVIIWFSVHTDLTFEHIFCIWLVQNIIIHCNTAFEDSTFKDLTCKDSTCCVKTEFHWHLTILQMLTDLTSDPLNFIGQTDFNNISEEWWGFNKISHIADPVSDWLILMLQC